MEDALERLKKLEDGRLKKLEEEIDDLKRFRSWVTGIAVGIGAIITFFAEGIRKRFGF